MGRAIFLGRSKGLWYPCQMDSKRRKHFEELIRDQLAQVEGEIDSLKELTKPISPDNAIGRLSRMEALNEKSVHESNLGKSKLRFSQLKKALERVAGDDFGLCLRCEEEISEKRLQILPESTICMDCLQGKNDD